MSSAGYACREFVEDVTAYIEGALPDERVALIEAHLATCPPCREYLAQMRFTVAATGTLGESEIERLPDDVRERLLDAFREPD
jgi:anti-sigma factor RsiW